MSARHRKMRTSWQTMRLLEFAENEVAEAEFYEIVYEKLANKIPMKVLTVMVFFLKEQYRNKPGSLVTLYRTAFSGDAYCTDFEKRYALYYEALQEHGYL